MLRSLWVAKTGLEAQQNGMDVVAQNLANVQTTGYKRERPVFQDLLYQTVRMPGAQTGDETRLPTGLQYGTGVMTAAVSRIHSQGNLDHTESDFNVAIQGKGFFSVLLPDGTTAYTRDGNLQLDADGQITTSDGYVLQPAIVVPENATKVSISKTGIVSVTQPGQAGSVQIGQMQVSTFINPPGLQSMGQNLYIETDASGQPNDLQPGTDGAGLLDQDYLEASNVNVAEELVNMISTQRAYELNSKAISSSDQMLERLTNL